MGPGVEETKVDEAVMSELDFDWVLEGELLTEAVSDVDVEMDCEGITESLDVCDVDTPAEEDETLTEEEDEIDVTLVDSAELELWICVANAVQLLGKPLIPLRVSEKSPPYIPNASRESVDEDNDTSAE